VTRALKQCFPANKCWWWWWWREQCHLAGTSQNGHPVSLPDGIRTGTASPYCSQAHHSGQPLPCSWEEVHTAKPGDAFHHILRQPFNLFLIPELILSQNNCVWTNAVMRNNNSLLVAGGLYIYHDVNFECSAAKCCWSNVIRCRT
jgi:hypothetical protein